MNLASPVASIDQSKLRPTGRVHDSTNQITETGTGRDGDRSAAIGRDGHDGYMTGIDGYMTGIDGYMTGT